MLQPKQVRAASVAALVLMALAAALMCPIGTLAATAVLALASRDLNPGLLRDRLASTGVLAGIVCVAMIPAVRGASVPWAVCCAVPLVFLFGRQRPDDETRYLETRPECLPDRTEEDGRPGKSPDEDDRGRDERRLPPVSVNVNVTMSGGDAGRDREWSGSVIDVTPVEEDRPRRRGSHTDEL